MCHRERLLVSLSLLCAFPLLPQSSQWEVRGRVSLDNEPLSNVGVWINAPDSSHTKTSSSGSFTLRGSVSGTFQIVAQRPESAMLLLRKTVTVAAGQIIADIDFHFAKGAAVSGRISEATNNAEGLVVAAIKLEKRDGIESLSIANAARSDDRGEYRISGLPPGRYSVAVVSTLPRKLPLERVPPSSKWAREATVLPPLTFSPGVRDLAGAYSFDLTGGEEKTAVDVRLARTTGHCVKFQVASPEQEAAPRDARLGVGVTEWVGAYGIEEISGGEVSPGGHYRVCGLPSGEYRISLSSLTVRPFRITGSSRSPFVISKSSVDVGVVQFLAPVPLAGKLSVEDNQQVPNKLKVRLRATGRKWLPQDEQPAEVQPDGSFQLLPVLVEDYRLLVEGLPANHYIARVMQGGRDVTLGGLTPLNGSVDVTLSSGGASLQGLVVRGKERTPVPFGTVLLVAADGYIIHRSQCDQFGRYRFVDGVRPGLYVAFATAREPIYLDKLSADELRGRPTVLLKPRESLSRDFEVSGQ